VELSARTEAGARSRNTPKTYHTAKSSRRARVTRPLICWWRLAPPVDLQFAVFWRSPGRADKGVCHQTSVPVRFRCLRVGYIARPYQPRRYSGECPSGPRPNRRGRPPKECVQHDQTYRWFLPSVVRTESPLYPAQFVHRVHPFRSALRSGGYRLLSVGRLDGNFICFVEMKSCMRTQLLYSR
jgi:hypothetical protein